MFQYRVDGVCEFYSELGCIIMTLDSELTFPPDLCDRFQIASLSGDHEQEGHQFSTCFSLAFLLLLWDLENF